MIDSALQYPIFGAEIQCPHCHRISSALILTDIYLCELHGAFEANPHTKELIHQHSGRIWRRWEDKWYRQHTHPDGIRFEIHDRLDKLYNEKIKCSKVIIARRYQELMSGYIDRVYGLTVEFSPETDDPRWEVINFEVETKPISPVTILDETFSLQRLINEYQQK